MIENTRKTWTSTASTFPSATSFSDRTIAVERRLSSQFILVIADSPTIQKIIEVVLRREGYDVLSFRNGIDAMQWCASPQSRTPDLMLVDLSLPKMNAYEIIQKFKAKPRFANTVCMILSQRTGFVDKSKGQVAGVIGYMSKPFTSQELITKVQRLLSNR